MEILKFGADDPAQPLLVFLHGFPGYKSRQNRDIAEHVSAMTGWPAHVLLYAGLGCAPGTFSFPSCVEGVRGHLRSVAKDHPGRRVFLVGHSWGGFLSLLMANEFKTLVRGIALLSPLLRFHSREEIHQAFIDMRAEYASIPFPDPNGLAEQFVAVGGAHDTSVLIGSLEPRLKVLFLQSRTDEITPTAVAEEKLGLFPSRPEYELVDLDHSFLGGDRRPVGERLASFARSTLAPH